MTTGNRSSAVMQQRAEPHDSLDYFPTPPWATRALCLFLENALREPLGQLTCWEPACGELHMVRPLREHFARVEATDIYRYSDQHGICDFLMAGAREPVDWIVSNFPFNLADRFIAEALHRTRRGVVAIQRTAFTEGEDRYHQLYQHNPPDFVVTYVERVVMLKGRLIRANAPDPFNLDDQGKPRKASTATATNFYVWNHNRTGPVDPRHRWIAPCRKQLERDGDYPAYPEQWAAIRAPQEGELL